MSDVEINYKGDSLATLNNSGTKTLLTSGKYCEDDIEIVYTKPEGSSINVIPLSVTENGGYTAPTGTAFSPVIVDVSSGGDMNDPIRFFDYDGTLVASYWDVPASLPDVPTHDNLVNGTWNYTLAQIATQYYDTGTCDVGANYDTVFGATEIDIGLDYEDMLHPYLSLAINGTVTIDWGDGYTDTATGTSLTDRKSDIHHEYAETGWYIINITLESGTGYSLYCSDTYPLLNKNSGTSYANRFYSNCVKAVRVGEDCTIGSNAFYNCNSLESVSIPSSVSSIGSSSFYYCYSLAFLAIPSGVISINNYTFYSCYSMTLISMPLSITSISNGAFSKCDSLTSVSIPSGVTYIGTYVFEYCSSLTLIFIPSSVTSISGNTFYSCYLLTSVWIQGEVTSIGSSAFANCYSLTNINIPNSVTSIGDGAFAACYSLVLIDIPNDVTSIGSSAFSECYGMAKYFFWSETPPTLANTNAFSNIQSDCVIYVPEGSLTAYQTANNWSTYASYIQENV